MTIFCSHVLHIQFPSECLTDFPCFLAACLSHLPVSDKINLSPLNSNPSCRPLNPLMAHTWERHLNTLRPRQNGCHFVDDIFKRIFLNENILIPIKISLKFVPKGSINNIPALVQIMAWRLPGDKLLSEPMMVNLPTHICVTRPL